MEYLRHGQWSYKASVITADFPDGRVVIPVCTQTRPKANSFFISRKAEDGWVICPVRFNPGRVSPYSSFDDAGKHCELLHLTGNPPGLAELFE